jgi:hypothetical protein
VESPPQELRIKVARINATNNKEYFFMSSILLNYNLVTNLVKKKIFYNIREIYLALLPKK